MALELLFFFEAWRSPAEETQNIAPMRGSPTDSRICTKRSLNLLKVLSTFKAETMGYKQAFLNLQYVDLVSGNVVLCRMVIEVVSVRGKPWSPLVPRNSPVAGRDTSPIGRVSGSGLSRAWVVFEPPPPPATERVGPGIGIQVRIECLLSCDAFTPVQS